MVGAGGGNNNALYANLILSRTLSHPFKDTCQGQLLTWRLKPKMSAQLDGNRPLISLLRSVKEVLPHQWHLIVMQGLPNKADISNSKVFWLCDCTRPQNRRRVFFSRISRGNVQRKCCQGCQTISIPVTILEQIEQILMHKKSIVQL